MTRLSGGRLQFAPQIRNTESSCRPKPACLKICVVGGGLAGLTAALALAERQQNVTLIECNSYLGGKIGSWPASLPNGEKVNVSHGFHAFFAQYYNLRRVLERVGSAKNLKRITDYLIICDAKRYSFGAISRVPLFNIISMILHGYIGVGIFFRPQAWRLIAMLAYDHHRVFRHWDKLSFHDFAQKAKLTKDFRLIMNNICRAYFAAEDEISTAEIMKASHAYFFSNDLGLVYDYMADDYHNTIIEPFESAFMEYGVTIKRDQRVESVEVVQEKFIVDGEEYDRLILACDITGARGLILKSDSIRELDPLLHLQMSRMKTAKPYSVVRLWLDSDPFENDLPVFIFLKRIQYLDSLTLVHRAEQESAEWSQLHHGAVIELHCYGISEKSLPSLEAISNQILQELYAYFPAAQTATVLHRECQLREDFPSFAPGQNTHRPMTTTKIQGLSLAGDWVQLPIPAMLMEAACTSGLLAANIIIDELGFIKEQIESVPLKGVLAAPKPLIRDSRESESEYR